MKLERHRIALQPIGLQRLVHVPDDVTALAQLAQGRLHPLAQLPDTRRVFGGEAHLLQLAQAAQAQRPVELAAWLGRFMAQVDKAFRSEEHTSELQSLMRISYAVFCLKKNKNT